MSEDNRKTSLPGLGPIAATRKTGDETFTVAGAEPRFTLLDFWRWSVSDLVSNATRGILAEFIVAQALGLARHDVRQEWASYDLYMPNPDDIKVEVKSAAHIQSWAQKKYSPISFQVGKRRGWDELNGADDVPRRHADVYVLALLDHFDQSTIDPLNLDQWRFFVVPTGFLNERVRSQHSITLASLAKAGFERIHFSKLAATIRDTAREHRIETSRGAPE